MDGQEAVMIIPSEDQSMKGQWGLIVKYPEPVTISGHTYPYLILWAHGDHIRDIAGTISFQR
ncbi:MAG: hypothetical protein HYY09_07355 [Firmicutes bacterium]|nr:hypothetical protein [Bacillota bacterium]